MIFSVFAQCKRRKTGRTVVKVLIGAFSDSIVLNKQLFRSSKRSSNNTRSRFVLCCYWWRIRDLREIGNKEKSSVMKGGKEGERERKTGQKVNRSRSVSVTARQMRQLTFDVPLSRAVHSVCEFFAPANLLPTNSVLFSCFSSYNRRTVFRCGVRSSSEPNAIHVSTIAALGAKFFLCEGTKSTIGSLSFFWREIVTVSLADNYAGSLWLFSINICEYGLIKGFKVARIVCVST